MPYLNYKSLPIYRYGSLSLQGNLYYLFGNMVERTVNSKSVFTDLTYCDFRFNVLV